MIQIKKILTTIPHNLLRRGYHVTVVGGASEIGQSVSLLLRTLPTITKLVIHDNLEQTSGIVLDLSHIPTNSSLLGYIGKNTLDRALKETNLVIATGGTIHTPGTSEKNWFKTNADFIKTLSARIAKVTPMPFVGIATEPINILVPMAAEIIKNNGGYDPKKMFGITCADALRVQTLYAAENDLKAHACFVPVIGGHSDETIVPLLSQAKPTCTLDDENIQKLTAKIRSSQEDIIKAKNGWSPTLSVAYGVFSFARTILDALYGRPTQINAFVENNDFGTSYFAGCVFVDKDGVGEMQRYPNISHF